MVRRRMKPLGIFAALPLWVISLSAAEPPPSADSEAAQWQRIYERLKKDGEANIEEMMQIPIFRANVVHPAFGIRWDEVPPPTLTHFSAMAAVNAFLATNGWNMHTGVLGHVSLVENRKPLRGLPWKEIQDREFSAVTHSGFLYVILKGWHYNDSGVAFNPTTNAFAKSIAGFKPLTGHWYVWAQAEDSITLAQIYEGQKTSEPDGSGPGSQPPRAETNRTPSEVRALR